MVLYVIVLGSGSYQVRFDMVCFIFLCGARCVRIVRKDSPTQGDRAVGIGGLRRAG